VPHHKSAVKRVRQTKVKTQRNKTKITMVKNTVKKIQAAIEAGDKATASAELTNAQSKLARLAKVGVIKSNTAARKTSRLTAAVTKLS